MGGVGIGNRPRAAISRRMYAEGEAPPPDLPPASGGGGGASSAGGGGAPSKPLPPGAQREASSSNRIDPSQIPRPTASSTAERFLTRTSIGALQPPAASNYIAIDDGNASPRLMRLTLNQISTLNDATKACAIPIAAICQPLAEPAPGEAPIPVVDPGPDGPMRCGRCRAYINPFFTFVERGNSFQCNLCQQVTPVPRDQVCDLDHHGYRRDHAERPELNHGAVEFVAPPEYQARTPLPPPLVLVLEVTQPAITSLVTDTVLTALSAVLPTLPPHTRVALIAFNDAVHFFTPPLREESTGEGALRTFMIPDLDEMCLPLPPEQLLLPLSESRQGLLSLFDTMKKRLFQGLRRPDSAFGAAVEAARLLLEPTGGRCLVFQHTLPGIGPLKLVHRDDVRCYGTEREKALLQPASADWSALASRLAASHTSVSTFHFTTHNFVDLASIATLAKGTGGQVYHYTMALPEHRDAWGPKLQMELYRNLSRPFGFEGVMRARASAGLRVDQYLWGSALPGERDVDVPGIDADSSFAIMLAQEEKIPDGSSPCIQTALLYTNAAGQRRIRVLTISLLATSSMPNVYRYADLDALLNVMMRQAVIASTKNTLHAVRESIVSKCVDILANYRKTCAASTSAGQLILPEALKLLPLYALSLTKVALLRAGTDVRADERSSLLAAASRMSPLASLGFAYPRLYSVRTILSVAGSPPPIDPTNGAPTSHQPELHATLPLSMEKLDQSDMYLLDDAVSLTLWIGRSCPSDMLEAILGLRSLEGVDCGRIRLKENGNSSMAVLNNHIDAIRLQRSHIYQVAQVVGPKDPSEPRFLAALTEDRAQTSMTYVEFLCHVHRQIQNKLS